MEGKKQRFNFLSIIIIGMLGIAALIGIIASHYSDYKDKEILSGMLFFVILYSIVTCYFMLKYYVIVDREKIVISRPFRKDVVITDMNFLRYIDMRHRSLRYRGDYRFYKYLEDGEIKEIRVNKRQFNLRKFEPQDICKSSWKDKYYYTDPLTKVIDLILGNKIINLKVNKIEGGEVYTYRYSLLKKLLQLSLLFIPLIFYYLVKDSVPFEGYFGGVIVILFIFIYYISIGSIISILECFTYKLVISKIEIRYKGPESAEIILNKDNYISCSIKSDNKGSAIIIYYTDEEKLRCIDLPFEIYKFEIFEPIAEELEDLKRR